MVGINFHYFVLTLYIVWYPFYLTASRGKSESYYQATSASKNVKALLMTTETVMLQQQQEQKVTLKYRLIAYVDSSTYVVPHRGSK